MPKDPTEFYGTCYFSANQVPRFGGDGLNVLWGKTHIEAFCENWKADDQEDDGDDIMYVFKKEKPKE